MVGMIQIDHLVKQFGTLKAVDDISFAVQRGEVLGFLGPNGAGKTTTMRMITGFLEPTSGRIQVCGLDVDQHPLKVKERIGYLPEGAPLYPDMTPRRFLEFVAEVRGFRGPQKRERIHHAVELLHLGEVLGQPIDTLSKGFKRRVGLAQAILHDPEVLILDEPTDGLDPNQKEDVRNLIRRMREEKVLLLSTHILEEVDAVCSRAIIISNGRLVFDGTPEALQTRSRRHNAVRVSIRTDDPERVKKELSGLEEAAEVEVQPADNGSCGFLVYSRDRKPILKAVTRFVRAGSWEIEELHVEQGRLDEVFREITTGRKEKQGRKS